MTTPTLAPVTVPPCRVVPPLDPDFQPAVLAARSFQDAVKDSGVPLVIGLFRDRDQVARVETQVFPDDDPRAEWNPGYVERLVKFVLWQRGGHTLLVGGSPQIAEHLRRSYSATGCRRFDHHFMGDLVYERPFTVVGCSRADVPPAHETPRALGRHLDGCRIGFDLGASDLKVSAVVDGHAVWSDEAVWEPKIQADPEYHYREVKSALLAAAAKMPRVDAIGGSSAGIYIDNRPMVASLFRAIPPERYPEVRSLFERLGEEMKVPLEVINDGDVTALAGSMSLGEGGVLGLALGSSLAAGYVDRAGRLTGWINELSFAPIDVREDAPLEEWSGDRGCGSQYLSQEGVFRLAPRAEIRIPEGLKDAERLRHVQALLEAGHGGAERIWETIGVYLGYAIAHYATFYDVEHVLVLGRCVSGRGGMLVLGAASAVLKAEFPELASRIHIRLPDERSRRVGQAIAAASLPALGR
jgi:predicted NBD/HSP70 family sugar kinase